MKKLNKLILVFIIFVAVLAIYTTVSSAATLDVRNKLKDGSRGEQVKLLQTELNAVMNAGLTVDGILGPKTVTAIKNFQTKYGLTADGIAGIDTCSALNIKYSANNNYVVVYVDSGTNGGKLNVREKASSSSTKLGTIASGTTLIYYGTTKTNGTTWYKIKYNGKYAYISSSYAFNTCTFLDLSDQIVKFYKNGKLKLEAPVITGSLNINGDNKKVGAHPTPTGKHLFTETYTFSDGTRIKCKMSPKNLSGNNDDGTPYSRDVQYWMNFIPWRGIGFHDATWRSNSQFYDINTYKTSGSHGCVNMRLKDAKALYDLIPYNSYVLIVE